MKWFFLMLLVTASCGTHPSVANDDDPGYCSEKYPFEETPDVCESSSYGDCCSWEIEVDGETCRYDYCSYYGEADCDWELQYTSCGGTE